MAPWWELPTSAWDFRESTPRAVSTYVGDAEVGGTIMHVWELPGRENQRIYFAQSIYAHGMGGTFKGLLTGSLKRRG